MSEKLLLYLKFQRSCLKKELKGWRRIEYLVGGSKLEITDWCGFPFYPLIREFYQKFTNLIIWLNENQI